MNNDFNSILHILDRIENNLNILIKYLEKDQITKVYGKSINNLSQGRL